MIPKLFILLILINYIRTQTMLSMSCTTNPSSIGATSTLSLTISSSPNFVVPVGAAFTLSYPIDFTNTNPTCSVSAFPVLSLSSPCTATANQILMNTGHATAANYFSITVTITGFVNPSAIEYTGFFGFTIKDSNGNIIAKTSGNTLVALERARLSQCQFTSISSDVVGTTTSLTLDINTINNIPAGGVIRIESPTWDSTALDPNLKYFFQPSVSCTPISSNVASTVSCTFDSSNGNITIKNGFSSPATVNIKIAINNVRTPLNTGPSGNFKLTTLTSSGTVLEFCDDLSFRVNIPGPISDWGITCQQKKINSNGYCDMRFKITNALTGPANIILTAPPEMKVLQPISVLYASPISLFDISITPGVSSNTIALNRIVPSGKNFPQNTQIQLIVTTFQLPSSLARTSSFSVTTYVNGYKVDEATSGFFFQPTDGDILFVNSLAADNLVAGQNTNYRFDLTLTSTIPSSGGIYIKFPNSIALNPTCGLIEFSSNINSATAQCNAEVSNNYIILSNLFSSSLPAGQAIYFEISGIRNPQSTEPTSSLLIYSLQNALDATSGIDQNKTTNISFITPGPLNLANIVITPLSQITSDITAYTFQFVNKNPCTVGGRVEILFNKGIISFPVKSSTESSLVSISNINPFATVSIQETTTSYIISVANAFTLLYTSGTQFSFSLDFIKNPPTTQTFSNIIFTTYTANNYIIDKSLNGYSLQVTTPHNFETIRIIAETLQNGMSGYYQVQVNLKEDHFNNDKINITFPTELDLNLDNVVLLPGLGSSISISSFTQSGNSAIIKLAISSTSLPAGSKISFMISALKNNVFSTPIGQFAITSSDNAGFLRSRSIITNTSLATEPALLTFPETSMSLSNTILGQSGTAYRFKITRINSFGATGSIDIVFPGEIEVSSTLVCSNFGGIASISCTPDVANRKVTVTGNFDSPPTVIEFALNGITNPTVKTSGSFSITTKTASGVIVDRRTTDLRYNADCDLPCKECTSNRTQCTSCFTDSFSILNNLYGQTCVDVCPKGTTNENGKCLGCTLPCTECTTIRDQCTKCQSTPIQLYLYGTSCISKCPPTFYRENSTFICAPCSSKCSTCEDYDKCLTCPANKKLLNMNCVDSCPSDITIDDGTTCLPCNSNCATCKINVDFCSSCKTGLIPYNQQCLNTCPSSFYLDKSTGSCLPCTSPCFNCSTSSTLCTSCGLGKYLLGKTCIDNCPDGQYPDSSLRQCISCPNTCQTCTSLTNCLTCKSPNVLSLGNCVGGCPTGTYASGSTCTSCSTGCALCLGSPTICTSCMSGYTLSGSTCSPNCPAGSYNNGGSCAPCSSGCEKCFGPGETQCQTCTSGFFLTSSGSCSTSCPTSYYADKTLNKCLPCNVACSSCFGPSISECYSCVEQYVLFKSSCLAECPKEISIQDGKTCNSCNSVCKTCSGTPDNCTSCHDGYLSTKSGSISTCEDVNDTSMVPFPFLTIGFILGVAVIGAKTISSQTILITSLITGWSIILHLAVMIMLILMIADQYFNMRATIKNAAILTLLGVITNYLNNFIYLILTIRFIKKDTTLSEWKTKPSNIRCFYIALGFSMLTTFNFDRLIYSNLLGRQCFSADLKSPGFIKIIDYLTIWHIVSSNLPTFIGACYQLGKGPVDNQISVTAIEIIILTLILCFLFIFNVLSYKSSNNQQTKIAIADIQNKSSPERKDNYLNEQKDQNKSNFRLLQEESRLDTSAILRCDTIEANYFKGNMNSTKREKLLKEVNSAPKRQASNEFMETENRRYGDETLDHELNNQTQSINHLDALTEDRGQAKQKIIFPKTPVGDYSLKENVTKSEAEVEPNDQKQEQEQDHDNIILNRQHSNILKEIEDNSDEEEVKKEEEINQTKEVPEAVEEIKENDEQKLSSPSKISQKSQEEQYEQKPLSRERHDSQMSQSEDVVVEDIRDSIEGEFEQLPQETVFDPKNFEYEDTPSNYNELNQRYENATYIPPSSKFIKDQKIITQNFMPSPKSIGSQQKPDLNTFFIKSEAKLASTNQELPPVRGFTGVIKKGASASIIKKEAFRLGVDNSFSGEEDLYKRAMTNSSNELSGSRKNKTSKDNSLPYIRNLKS